ncbi:uncharacterized protein TNCV_4213281 [Trichonephila clavipes]|nr:uncharacterized protein TNCV_4213281 [Trichonephila clavipes]
MSDTYNVHKVFNVFIESGRNGGPFRKKRHGYSQRSTRDLPLHSAKFEINRIYKKGFRDAARNKSWRVLLKPNCVSNSHHAAVAEFRLLTRHDCLCAHLYRFNLADSLLCASG